MGKVVVGLVVAAVIAMVPSFAAAQIELCSLLNAQVQAGDGQFLGIVTPNRQAPDSLVNPNGAFGSTFSLTSISNTNGPYGNSFNPLSVRNPSAADPPRILVNGQIVARLTINQNFSPRLDPDTLLGWLRSDAPSQCMSVTPTAPPATPTRTFSPSPSAEPTQPATSTPTNRPPTITPTQTRTPTASASPTITNTPTQTRTPSNTFTPTNTPTPGPCYGDCNFDGQISIADLITGVGIALGNRPLSACRNLDITGDGTISVGELVRAVGGALNGCVALDTPTPTRPTATATATPTRTFTVLPTATPPPPPSPTATQIGDCPAVTPAMASFRALGELSEIPQELADLASSVEVTDPRQRHHVRASLSACSAAPPGEVTFHFSGPTTGERSVTVPIENDCGDIADVSAGVTYDLPLGEHPISIAVSGSGTYTGGAVTVSAPPFEVVETRSIQSPLSLLAGESEIPDLRVTTTLGDGCRAVELSVRLAVAGLETGIEYQIVIGTEGESPQVSESFAAGTISQPSAGELTATYAGLPPGPRTFSVSVIQTGGGPAIYEEASQSTLSIR